MPTPANSTGNTTGNITDATPLPASPTPVPTPLATDVNRTRPGMSFATIFSILTGLVFVGYVAYLGYIMVKK
jgi:hypothetical protein